MRISLSARKRAGLGIKSHLDFVRTHAEIEGELKFQQSDIDAVWGSLEGSTSPMYGGRISPNVDIFLDEVYWLYDKGIGVKIPLSTVYFDETLYKNTKNLLKEYHRKGNIVLVSTDKFAQRLREDFPLFQIEMSAVKDITSIKDLNKIDRSLYDTIVLPMCANDDMEFLSKIENKEQIRLFLNVECSYTCPNKICYTSISKINRGEIHEEMKCSKYSLDLPRRFYNDDIDWGKFYFNKSEFTDMGFDKFKLIVPDKQSQRIDILYR